MMRWIFTLVFCLGVSYVFGQAPGTNIDDYYSKQTGQWNDPATWLRWNGTSWVDAAVAPLTAAAAQLITVDEAHTITISVAVISDQVTVNGNVTVAGPLGNTWTINAASAGVQLAIGPSAIVTVSAGRTLRRSSLTAAGQIAVNGIIRNAGTITSMSSTRLFFNAGSTYDHRQNNGTIPTASWDVTSNVIVRNIIDTAPNGLNQAFGNFQWIAAAQIDDVDLNAQLTNVRGTLRITNTNGFALLATMFTPLTMVVGGPLIISPAASFAFTIDEDAQVRTGGLTNQSNNFVATYGAGDVALDINGNVSNTGTFDVGQSTGRTDINLAGNFSNTGALVSTGGARLNLTFDGGIVQTYTSTFVPTFAVNYSTTGISNLRVAAASFLAGTGSLTINPGSFLTVTNVENTGALRNSTTLGNVRVSGARTYSGNIIYGGSAIQYMYGDTPNVATIINNTRHVNMAESVTFTTGTLTLQAGRLQILNNTTLSVANLVYGAGTFGFDDGSNLVLNGTGNIDLKLTRINTSVTGLNNLTINRAGTVTQTLTSMRVNGTLALSQGTLAVNSNTLQVYGPVTAAVGGALSATAGRLYVRGAGVLPANVPLSGSLTIWEVDRPGQTFTTSGALSIASLYLYGGDVAATGGAQMADGGTIYRTNGALIAAIGAAGLYNVQYTNFIAASITTGYEIPEAGNALNLVTINNTVNTTGIVDLSKAVVAAGQIRVWRGALRTNDFDVTTGGNFRVDNTGRLYPGSSTLTFTGAAVTQQYNTVASAYTPYTLMNVVINKTAGTVTIATPVDIRNSFAVNSITTVGTGTDRLRLLSDADNTAYIPALPGTTADTRAKINGTVIVQRYLPNTNSSRQYRYLSAPTTTNTTKVSDWQNEIPITGAFSNPSSGTFDGVKIISKNPSMFYYNEPTGAYVAHPASGSSTDASIVNGRGYAVFGRTHGVTPLTLDSHGTLAQWNVNVTVTNTVGSASNGYNLVGNPYPAPVDWDLVLPASLRIGGTIALTDNNHNATTSGTISYNGMTGIAVPANSFDGVISMGQAFWVTANAGAGSKQVRFQEVHKVAGQSKFIRKGEPDNLLRLAMTTGSITDHLAVVLLDSATDAFDDKYDGRKFETSGLRVATLSSNNDRLVINAIGKGGCEKVIPIEIAEAVTGSYTFNFTGIESFDANVMPVLYDKVENKSISIASTPTYAFTVSDATAVKDRFELRFDGLVLDTQLAVKGEIACIGTSTAIVTLPSTQAGVAYTAMLSGSPLSAPVVGNGGELQIPLSVDALPQGATEISISAKRSSCEAELLAQKATITILSKPTISSVLGGQVCGTGTTSLSATGVDGSLYNWYEALTDVAPIAGQHGSTFTTPTLNKTKTYFVAAVNDAGCEGERVEVKASVLDVMPAMISVNGNVLTSNYDGGNQWYLDGAPIGGATGKTLEVSNSGVYAVQVNTDACTTTSEGREMVILGMESKDSFVRIYPNPSIDKVYVEMRESSDAEVEIISTTGVQLRSASLSGSTDLKTATFDITSLPDGMYLIRIKAGNKLLTRKILKAK